MSAYDDTIAGLIAEHNALQAQWSYRLDPDDTQRDIDRRIREAVIANAAPPVPSEPEPTPDPAPVEPTPDAGPSPSDDTQEGAQD